MEHKNPPSGPPASTSSASPAPTSTSASGLDSRRAALDLLARIRRGFLLDEALSACISFDELEGPDRSFAYALTVTVLRRRGTIDHLLGAYIDRPLPKKLARVMDILRLAAAQTLFLGTPDHAAVSTAVTLAGDRKEIAGYAKLINAVARKVAKAGTAALEKVPARADTPAWMWRSWERNYGPQGTRAIAEAHRQEPPLDLTLKNPADATLWADRLQAETLPTGSLRLRNISDVKKLDGFGDGVWWVQDTAASLPTRLLGDVSGKKVFDLCAAPGGKTLQLAAAGAEVISVDISDPRLQRVRENLGRTGLTAAIVTEDVLRWSPDEKADAILLDAPCSATGTIRRHPDIPWVKHETDIAALTSLQARMIDHALSLLKPGGTLIYCVCSLQAAEGEKQAQAALKRHDKLTRKAVTADEISGFGEAINRHGDLRTLPSMLAEKGGMDGFYAARFILAA
ncbi:MAG: MFS transporter [Hyphococcus sp.]|nr:MAG: MFS transporter [Marinicaulis sp.]